METGVWIHDPWFIFAGPCELATKGFGLAYVIGCGGSWIMFFALPFLITVIAWALPSESGKQRAFTMGGSFLIGTGIMYMAIGIPR